MIFRSQYRVPLTEAKISLRERIAENPFLWVLLTLGLFTFVGCTATQVGENTQPIVDTAKTVLSAVGLGALNPLVDSVGKLVLWLAGPPAAVATAYHHVSCGLPFTQRRYKLKGDVQRAQAAPELADLLAAMAGQTPSKGTAEALAAALKNGCTEEERLRLIEEMRKQLMARPAAGDPTNVG